VATRDRYVNLPAPLCHNTIIPRAGQKVKQFSVYVTPAKKKPDPRKHGRSGLNPSKTSV
jgi:hypothetical protein